jgi:hypothetical protein
MEALGQFAPCTASKRAKITGHTPLSKKKLLTPETLLSVSETPNRNFQAAGACPADWRALTIDVVPRTTVGIIVAANLGWWGLWLVRASGKADSVAVHAF